MPAEPITAAAKETFGWIKRVFGWFRDFGAVPGNLKKLAAARDEDADQCIHCPSCGVGRIGNYRKIQLDQYLSDDAGKCDACGTWFWLRIAEHRLNGLVHNPPVA